MARASEMKPAEKEETGLKDIQAEIAKMLEEAKKEAARIVEEAKAAAGTESEDQRIRSEREQREKDYMEEYVEVKLFKDNGKYKDDVFVAVNGENCLIKRGERVKIKRKFAEVLDQSDLQDYETSKLIEQKSSEFARTGL